MMGYNQSTRAGIAPWPSRLSAVPNSQTTLNKEEVAYEGWDGFEHSIPSLTNNMQVDSELYRRKNFPVGKCCLRGYILIHLEAARLNLGHGGWDFKLAGLLYFWW